MISTRNIKITRNIDIPLSNETLFLQYDFNQLSDNDTDYLTINGTKYYINAIPNIIESYNLIETQIDIHSEKSSKSYFWGNISDKYTTNYHDLINLATNVPVNNGIKMIYNHQHDQLNKINHQNDAIYYYIYTLHKLTTIINIKITKQIQFVPDDPIFFETTNNINLTKIINGSI